MKKLFAIGLMALSPVTFAETVNPDLLVGKWQCKNDNFIQPYLTLTWNDTANFYKDGFYQRKLANHYDIDNLEKMNIIENSIGTWTLNNNVLVTQRRQSLGFSTDNPALAKKIHVAKHVNNYDVLYPRLVEVVSNDVLILRPTPEYKKENQILNDTKEICQRIY